MRHNWQGNRLQLQWRRVVMQQHQYQTSGFTLLELIVVLAGLSILSSLAIPNITRIFDFNNIDEVKSLLNTAAADCLQSARLNSGSNTQKIDPSILSNNRLNSIGYEINTSAKDCSYLELVPTNDAMLPD